MAPPGTDRGHEAGVEVVGGGDPGRLAQLNKLREVGSVKKWVARVSVAVGVPTQMLVVADELEYLDEVDGEAKSVQHSSHAGLSPHVTWVRQSP